MKKVIIFDMDGVIIDSIQIAYQYKLIAQPGITFEEYRELHTSSNTSMHILDTGKTERTPEQKELERAQYSKDKLESRIYPGIIELLQELHTAGYILVINTAAYTRNSLPLLEKANLAHLFDFIATRDTCESKVEKFKMIEEKYQVSNKEVIFITDAVRDIHDAEVAGVPTVAVT